MKIRNLTMMLMLLMGLVSTSFAQGNIKIGHINSAELLQLMPERASIQQELENYAKMLEAQLTAMTTEYQNKVSEYQTNESTWTQIVKDSKAREIGDLEKRIQEFQQTAQQDLSKKEQELVEPLIKKAQDAIDAVAKENGYTYVFDTSTGSVLVFPDSDNLLDLVKKHLGIQ